MSAKSKGVIYDRGYRPYEGRYLGRGYALAGFIGDELKRALGIKRSWKYRLAIILLLISELFIFFFYLLMSQLADFFGAGAPQTLLNPYSGFYEASAIVLLFLSALVAPALLCDDRRYRVYPLYLARPIRVYDYLWAKAGAIFGVLALVTLGPALLLFLGKTFLAGDALEYLSRHLRDLGALLASGLLLALFYTSWAMGISSLTVSRGYAAGAILGLIFLGGLLNGLLLFALREPWVMLLDLGDLPLRVKDGLFGTLSPIELPGDLLRIEPLSVWAYLAGALAVIALSWAIVWMSYHREMR